MELWKKKLLESINLYKEQYGEEQTIKKYEMFVLGLNDSDISIHFIKELPHSDIDAHKKIILSYGNPEMYLDLLKIDSSVNIEQVRRIIVNSGNTELINKFATLVNNKIGNCIDVMTGEITDTNNYSLLLKSSTNLLANGQIPSINEMYTFNSYSEEELVRKQNEEIENYNNLMSVNNFLDSENDEVLTSESISLKPLIPPKENELKDISDIINYEHLYGDNQDYKSL